jgi:hypothetical protein
MKYAQSFLQLLLFTLVLGALQHSASAQACDGCLNLSDDGHTAFDYTEHLFFFQNLPGGTGTVITSTMNITSNVTKANGLCAYQQTLFAGGVLVWSCEAAADCVTSVTATLDVTFATGSDLFFPVVVGNTVTAVEENLDPFNSFTGEQSGALLFSRIWTQHCGQSTNYTAAATATISFPLADTLVLSGKSDMRAAVTGNVSCASCSTDYFVNNL